MFTRRHYFAVAMVISNLPNKPEIAKAFASMFQADNPNFKREVFLKKCGVSNG